MKKILIIDDNPDILRTIKLLLEFNGYNVFATSDGYEGISIANKNNVDLIICDINMPVLSGLDVLEILRREPETVGLPFIFLTGIEKKEVFRSGMNMGADDFLTKPIDPRVLLQVIETRLEKHAVFKERSEKKLAELRDSLTSILPHELNTALNGILGFSEYLVTFYDENMDKEEVLDVARAIHTSGLRLQKITENFLLYSNLKIMQSQEEKLNILRKEILLYVKATILNVASLKAKDYKRQNDLVINVDDSLINIPQNFFHKIIDVLLDNAFKFSFPGQKIIINAKTEKGFYIINIIDNGKGILSENIEKIDAFVQFDRDTNEQQGTGMGLIIVKMLAELFKFEFKISSEINVKTEIKLIFKIP